MTGPARDAAAIERATGEDVDRLVELWTDLVAHGREFGLHLRAGANELPGRELLGAAVADDRILVARHDGRIVGFCTVVLRAGGLERDAIRGVIENLYVEPEARRLGLGTALLEAGEARLADLGADVVSVETMTRDEEVREFYEERDYRPHRLTLEKPVRRRGEGDRDASRNQ